MTSGNAFTGEPEVYTSRGKSFIKKVGRCVWSPVFKRVQPDRNNHGIAIPEIGRWYRRLNGNLFEVVAVDEDKSTVELQHFDGTIEGIELDAWWDIDLEPAVAPEDWSGSVDIDLEDLPDPERGVSQSWHDPLEFIDRYEQ